MKKNKKTPVKERYPDGRGKDEAVYMGYKILRTGDVYSPKGRKISVGRNKDNSRYVIFMMRNGQKKKMNLARVIYSIFSGKPVTMKEIVLYKDGNKEQVNFNNLYVVDRSEYYKMNKMNNKKLTKMIDDETVAKIKQEYKKQATDTQINQWNKKDISMRDLARKYNCSLYTIQRIVHDKY